MGHSLVGALGPMTAGHPWPKSLIVEQQVPTGKVGEMVLGRQKAKCPLQGHPRAWDAARCLSPRRWGSSSHSKLWLALEAGGIGELGGVGGPHLAGGLVAVNNCGGPNLKVQD